MKGLMVAIILAVALPAIASPEAAPGPISGPIVELNRATVEELQSLPGIGLKKAEAIIAQREKRPFTRVTQLLLVKGIGQKTLTRLKPRLAVRLVTPAATLTAAPAPAAPAMPYPEPTTPGPATR